jgi:hypothetical protein
MSRPTKSFGRWDISSNDEAVPRGGTTNEGMHALGLWDISNEL